jgi:hypothetical protein
MGALLISVIFEVDPSDMLSPPLTFADVTLVVTKGQAKGCFAFHELVNFVVPDPRSTLSL